MNLEKLLNAWVLLALNIVIIVAAEFSGSLFLETGLIHIIAFGFLVLGISRVFVHYSAFDRYLQPLIVGSVVALLFFTFSHMFEYMSFHITSTDFYDDTLYTTVTNIYLTAMLLITTGAQYFLSKKDSAWGRWYALCAASLATGTLTILVLMGSVDLAFEPDEPWLYAYALALVLVTVLCVRSLRSLGSHVSIMKSFAVYLGLGVVLIALSALHYVLYDILKDAGLPLVQVVYISHFCFYAALSVMFLAFPKIVQKTGMYLGAWT